MKYFLLLLLAVFTCFSCKNSSPDTGQTTEEPTDNGGSQDDPDLVAITGVVHGFYGWYEKFQLDDARNINFTDDRGKHLKLDPAKLHQYYNNLRASGFISEEFIENDRAMWKECEAAWQNEIKGDVPSCVDGDRFFCAQDWDLNFWTTAPVGAEGLGTDRVKATISGTEGGGPREQKLELVKENGKWLIAKIVCDLRG